MTQYRWARQKSRVRVDVALVTLISAVVVILLASLLTTLLSQPTSHTTLEPSHTNLQPMVSKRHLLADNDADDDPPLNCTPAAIDQYPRPLFTQSQRLDGAIVLNILVSIYMFLGLALVCDNYFVPSLEVICDMLKISADVGGATFMAAGSSAPELATAVIAVFISKDDIGVGTVVGSAVYNVTFVISICALFAGMVVYLHWWPLFRDCMVYTLSIVALILVIADGMVQWWESVILLAMYILYILLMMVNRHLEAWMLRNVTCCSQHLERTRTYHKIATESDSPAKNGSVKSDSTRFSSSNEKVTFDEYKDESTESTNHIYYEMTANNNHKTVESDSESDAIYTQAQVPHTALFPSDDDSQETVLTYPSGTWARVLYFVSFPLNLILYLTTPDCRLTRWRKWFVVTFVISLMWLSVFSYVIVWMITVIGYTFGIPDTIMGLTFVAFGVSIPDAIASFIVVREGEGDMAVSNAVGSNIFDILICLGVPWFIQTVLVETGEVVEVISQGLVYSAITLLSTVIILLGVTHLNKWKMDIKYGVVLMVMYVVVTILSALYEFDFFGISHLPECVSRYESDAS